MSTRSQPSRVRSALLGGPLALTVLLPALAACSAGEPEQAAEERPASTTVASQAAAEETSRPYLPVPEGVDLTDQGVDLPFGETATVAWQPRTTTVGALDITVAAVQRAPLSVFEGWRLDADTRRAATYFVRAKVENVGESDLAGVPVPLYLVDETDTLIQASSFASRFAPCPGGTFPRGFSPGEKVMTCLVFLVPDAGDAVAVSFRPTQEFSPITWTGEESTYDPKAVAQAKKRRQQQKAQQQQKQQQEKKEQGDDASPSSSPSESPAG